MAGEPTKRTATPKDSGKFSTTQQKLSKEMSQQIFRGLKFKSENSPIINEVDFCDKYVFRIKRTGSDGNAWMEVWHYEPTIAAFKNGDFKIIEPEKYTVIVI